MDANNWWEGLVRFTENRRRIPDEALRPYRGRHVAFSLDGTRVVADGATIEEMLANLEKTGADMKQIASEYVPGEGEECWL